VPIEAARSSPGADRGSRFAPRRGCVGACALAAAAGFVALLWWLVNRFAPF